MSKINATVVADSINPQGDRLTSLLITFPRILLSEVNTHRMLSKNTSSSRAIPFNKMVEAIENNPFIPIAWQKEHKGMQGSEYWIDDDTVTVDEGDEYERYTKIYSATEHFITEWLEARDLAIAQSYELNRLGVTKQLCNRLLEPFMWTTMLITGSKEGWDNFFNLRCPQYGGTDVRNNEVYFKSKKEAIKHLQKLGVNTINLKEDDVLGWLKINKGQAEIHMMALAEAIYDAVNESTPKELKENEWHLPMIEVIED